MPILGSEQLESARRDRDTMCVEPKCNHPHIQMVEHHTAPRISHSMTRASPACRREKPREEAARERVWAVDVPVHHLDHIVRQGVDGRLRQADLQDGFVMFIFVTLAGGESGRRNEMGFDRKESERLQ